MNQQEYLEYLLKEVTKPIRLESNDPTEKEETKDEVEEVEEDDDDDGYEEDDDDDDTET